MGERLEQQSWRYGRAGDRAGARIGGCGVDLDACFHEVAIAACSAGFEAFPA